MLGNRCLKVLRGGCTLLPKTSFPLLELIPSSKGLGLGPLGVPSSLSHWIWDHSCACLAVFGLRTPRGKISNLKKTQEKPEPGLISLSACSASWKLSC